MALIDTNTKGDGRRWRTAAKRIAPVIVVATAALGGIGVISYRTDNNSYNGLDNSSGFNDYATQTETQISNSATGAYQGLHNPDFSTNINNPDNGGGPGGDGQFRIRCVYSHFSFDDPILKPDRPGESHLHMFFGNTEAGADTTFGSTFSGDTHDVLDNGGSTCAGNVMNRSAYWVPALYDRGAAAGRNLVIPQSILLYYKSKRPWEVNLLPRGIQLLIGNVNPGGTVNDSFPTASNRLSWGCYDPSAGQAVNLVTTIPGTNGSAPCPAGQDIQASIEFPQCIAVDGNGDPVLTSPDFVSHTAYLGFGSPLGNQTQPCPASHPYRVPQISYLIRYPQGTGSENWRLSCDQNHEADNVGASQGSVPFPGGCLHGDWLGGWNELAHQAWLDGCFDPGPTQGVNNFNGPRNCSLGQLGQNQHFLNTGQAIGLTRPTPNGLYPGPFLLPDPCDDCNLIPYNTD